MIPKIPDNCTLVAVDCGEGWALEVHGPEGELIALLAWPEKWPKTMGPEDLEKCGFAVC